MVSNNVIWELVTLRKLSPSEATEPSGNAIAFRRREKTNSDVYVVAADASQSPRALAETPADEQDPSWSPAGDEIAYKSIAKSPDWPDSTLDRVEEGNVLANDQLLNAVYLITRGGVPADQGWPELRDLIMRSLQ